jgi:hypothetical protein
MSIDDFKYILFPDRKYVIGVNIEVSGQDLITAYLAYTKD